MLLKYLINMDRKTKIIATVGPSLSSESKIKKIIDAGANVLRINFSHGTLEDHENVISWARKSNMQVAIMQDIQGPKIRTGISSENTFLEKSKNVTLTNIETESNNDIVFINYENLLRDVNVDDRVFIDDGQIVLKVVEKENDKLEALILIGGELRDNQGVAFPDSNLSVSAITEKDIEHLKFGSEHDVDFVAVSFVRNASDINLVKEIIPKDIKVIAKIELKTALDNIDEILDVADGVMVARGDLGVQLPLEQVPFVQKQILDAANKRGKISITATEMLQSMKTSYRPTRAEVTDVANAVYEEADSVMLSGETSVGQYPVKSVEVLSRIASRNEVGGANFADFAALKTHKQKTVKAAVVLADSIPGSKIAVFTKRGVMANYISNLRPNDSSIYAFSEDDQILRHLCLSRGVTSIRAKFTSDSEETVARGIEELKRRGFADSGDSVIVLSDVLGLGPQRQK